MRFEENVKIEMRAAEEREKVLQMRKGEEVGGLREDRGATEKEGGSLTGHVLLMRSSSPIRSCFTTD